MERRISRVRNRLVGALAGALLWALALGGAGLAHSGDGARAGWEGPRSAVGIAPGGLPPSGLSSGAPTAKAVRPAFVR